MTAGDHATELQRLIKMQRTVPVAGVYDGLSAILAARADFEALYLSGAALSASMGLADLGLLTLDDVVHAARSIARVSSLPLIVDSDTGFGETLNVMRAVVELEQVGAACIQIEDQDFPKKCGHLSDKRLVPSEDMCRKIAAAKRASRHLLVCARTDAGAISADEAIRRAKAYQNAGADIIFVEAPTDVAEIRRIREEITGPLLGNMTEFGRTPFISASEWEELSYELVIFPVSALRVSARAVEDFYRSLRANGDVSAHIDAMMTRKELYDVIKYFEYEALDDKIVKSTLPHD
ncbi:isocitrate lyase/PEP mutase family protein [Microbaculum marinum]|uniref:Isocitrate lyase/phosphoenolpyruvate mutase family protein n=1 Tax=Microbaculum marinum TaxID=1764581 RepID=A0AAW9RPA3_9HYPH